MALLCILSTFLYFECDPLHYLDEKNAVNEHLHSPPIPVLVQDRFFAKGPLRQQQVMAGLHTNCFTDNLLSKQVSLGFLKIITMRHGRLDHQTLELAAGIM